MGLSACTDDLCSPNPSETKVKWSLCGNWWEVARHQQCTDACIKTQCKSTGCLKNNQPISLTQWKKQAISAVTGACVVQHDLGIGEDAITRVTTSHLASGFPFWLQHHYQCNDCASLSTSDIHILVSMFLLATTLSFKKLSCLD